jgi:hypothetical protein
MSKSKKLLLGATAGIVALAAAALPASAKGGHHHHARGFYGPVIVSSAPTGCDYYRWKWRQTGTRFWKSKYFACIG